jgi:acyl-coenzyme A thioesterase PaaI-like protein
LPPPVIPAPGWIAVQPFPAIDPQSFLVVNPSGARLRIAYFRIADSATLYARAWFGRETQGPPGHVHGGAMAAVLDEAMGAACWMNGHPTVAARIGVSFLEMLPVETETTVEAWIERKDGRKVQLRARLSDASGTAIAEADGLFIVLPDERLRAF